MNQLSILTSVYSMSALLTTIKKEQVFADWRIVLSNGGNVVVSYTEAKNNMSENVCCEKFLRQLDDEMLREKLEVDYKDVRNMLVEQAFTSIIHSSTRGADE